MGMTIEETTDPKCLQCPINAKCMTCEFMMQKVKERREKYEADRCRYKKIAELEGENG